MGKYDDIINYNYVPKNKMSLQARSAQFAPFAALSGYDDNIKKASILLDKKIIIDEGLKNKLDDIINSINIKDKPLINIIYFNNELSKYIEYSNNIKKIDYINKELVFTNRDKIKIDDIIDISY